MVFKTLTNFTVDRIRGPDQFWKSRRVKRLTAHMYGRVRNCYRLAIRMMHHSLRDTTISRQIKKKDIRALHDLRVEAASRQHGINGQSFHEGIQRNVILLNKKVLSDLAAWEPRSFKALTDVAKVKILEDSDLRRFEPFVKEEDVAHFYHRGLKHDK